MFSYAWLFVLLAVPLASGQLQTISVIHVSTTTSLTTLSTSTPSSSSSSSSSTSATTSVASGTSSSTSTTTTTTTTDDPLILTTIFTQPTDCATGITEIEAWSTELWQNIVNPVPTLTLSSCYPSQLLYSAVATDVLPPFKQLVCPLKWETYDVNSTYIICCPSGYGLYAPSYNITERPGLGAVCTSMVWPSMLMDITSYDATSLATTIATDGGSDGVLVFATAFDGTLATSIGTSTSTTTQSTTQSTTRSTTSTTTSTTKSTSTPSSVSTTSSSSRTSSSSSTTTSSRVSSTTVSAGPTAISQLPTCGQTCFSNMLAQYASLGCTSADPSCVCENINFYYGIRDCSNAACGTDVASTVIAFETAYCSSAIATATVTTTTTTTTSASTPTAISDLPACGQTCFSNMLGQYASLGCTSADPSCVCENINFYYGIRDCSNGACGTDVASTVIAFESAYCASATATVTTQAPTPTAISDLPACGQTCFSNMLGQYASLGCTSANPSCVCKNTNFYYGIRDCSNGACGTDVASTVIAFESSYCSSALAAATAR